MDEPPEARSEEDAPILEDVAQYGFVSMRVGQSDDDLLERPDWSSVPDWTYTIGLYARYGHPELVAFRLEEEIVSSVFWDLVDQIEAGRAFHAGTVYEDALPSFEAQKCAFEPVDSGWIPELFGYGSWFYLGEDFPVLQYVWPDNTGLFASHPGASRHLRAAQRDLAEPPARDGEPPPRRPGDTTAWIGLVHLDGPPGHVAFEGALGAYVNVLALARSKSEFEALVRATLADDGLSVDNIDDPEPLSDRLETADVADELLDLARGLSNDEPVALAGFHTYLEE